MDLLKRLARRIAARYGIGIMKYPTSPFPRAPIFDLSVHYPINLSRIREGLNILPGVAFYNVFNVSNFNGFNAILLNQGDAGTPGYVNGPSDQTTLDANRVQRSSGTFDAGGPRTTEFQLKLNF